jgi:hypothetical protein
MKGCRPTIWDRKRHYINVHLNLVDPYMRRVLSYDSDALNAFSGIISAQFDILGHFHLGLPVKLLARALLLCVSKSQKRWPSFEELRPLVQIHAFDAAGDLVVLLGEWDDGEAVEGYCGRSIETYNKIAPSGPLPIHPSIQDMPTLPPDSGATMSQVLVFWTHVARVYLKSSSDGDGYMSQEFNILDHGHETLVEVVLIGVRFEDPIYGEGYYGIIIERYHGFARRNGIAIHLSRKKWLSGNPKKELIVLM